jgi:hypothetical protein
VGALSGEVHDCIVSGGQRGFRCTHQVDVFQGLTSHAVFEGNISRRNVKGLGWGFQIQHNGVTGAGWDVTLIGNRSYGNSSGLTMGNTSSIETAISLFSQRNVFEKNLVGLYLHGGRDTAPVGPGGSQRCRMSVESVDDAIWNNVGDQDADLAGGIKATADFRSSPLGETSNDNRLRLSLVGTRFCAPSGPQNCMGTARCDARIYGGLAFGGATVPGSGNLASLVLRQCSSDGTRAFFLSASTPSQPPDGEAPNQVTIAGSPNAFRHTNVGIATPPAEFFTGRN